MMGLEGMEPEVDDKKRIIPLNSHGIKCMSMGFLMKQDAAVVWRGLMVMSAVQQLLRQVSWGPLHTLVVDMPPGTGDVALSICQNVPVQGVVIVTTPQAVATSDTRRGMDMLTKLKVPILGIVANMTEFICPCCGHHTPLFGHTDHNNRASTDAPTGVDQLAHSTGLPVLARIPIDPRLVQSADAGTPLTLAYPESEVAQIYLQLAQTILKCNDGASTSSIAAAANGSSQLKS